MANDYGAGADNVISFDVINTWEVMADPSADLKVVSVDADNYPDLFWGLRVCPVSISAGNSFRCNLHEAYAKFKLRLPRLLC